MIDYGNSRFVGVMAGCMSWGCARRQNGQLLASFRAVVVALATFVSYGSMVCGAETTVAGSPRMQEYCQSAFGAYLRESPNDDASLNYRLAGTVDAVDLLRRGGADLAIIERDLTEEERANKQDNNPLKKSA